MTVPPLLPFHRVLKLGMVGYDVWGGKRAVYRFLSNEQKWQGFLAQAPIVKRTFGPFFRQDLISAQHILTAGVDGWFDEETLRALEAADAFDAIARGLWLHQYEKPKPPPLVEPIEGFQSLVSDLWADYSIGRRMSMVDLGTYNPRSVLPGSGAPSDHATSRLDGKICEPACAFDLGIMPQNGWDNPVGRKFFEMMTIRPEIHYVILGDRIFSKEQGLHTYTAGGHENHVHTSGYRR